MVCPKCGHKDFLPDSACPACDFRGPPQSVERLSQLKFLLSELETWEEIPNKQRHNLQKHYQEQLLRVEIELGLRARPADDPAIRRLNLELDHLTALRSMISQWQKEGVLTARMAAVIQRDLDERIADLKKRLANVPALPGSPALSFERNRFLSRTLSNMRSSNAIQDDAALAIALSRLDEERKQIEQLLQRQPPAPPQVASEEEGIVQEAQDTSLVISTATQKSTTPATPPEALIPSAPVKSSISSRWTGSQKLPSSAPPRKTRPPLTWERLLETLLSERTLNILLFLGAGLLFAAAVSLVVWNWQAFPPWLQVTFLALFTGVFYALGWYVRTRMKLRGSGIALSAVASLLVPLDFYAFYLSGGLPRESWPQVWLLASFVCLLAYLLTVYLVQAEFFGYLVGLALGSALAAILQLMAVSRWYWPPTLIGLALGLGLAAWFLQRMPQNRWALLSEPFWRLALLGSVVVIISQVSHWFFSDSTTRGLLRLSLALDGWLGGGVYILGAGRYRSRWLGIAGAASLSLATLFTQSLIYEPWGLSAPWGAAGLALLAAGCLFAGRRFQALPVQSAYRIQALPALWAGGILIVLSGIWSFFDNQAAALVHPWLALTILFSARAWRRPGLLYLTSLFLLSSAAFWISTLDATLAQLGLAWSLLTILHIIAGICLNASSRLALSNVSGRTEGDVQSPLYDLPLFVSAWCMALLAQLPGLISNDRQILSYTFSNWVAINGWLAWLFHSLTYPGLKWLFDERFRKAYSLPSRQAGWPARYLLPRTFLHWVQSISSLAWLWILWTESTAANAWLGVAYATLGCVLLVVGSRLKRASQTYGTPWFVTAHLSILIGLAINLAYYARYPMAVSLLLAALFSFAYSAFNRRSEWLYAGGACLPLGWILGLSHFGLTMRAQLPALALVPLAYTLSATWLEKRNHAPRSFLAPLHLLAQAVSLVAFFTGLILLILNREGPELDLWVAFSAAILGASFGLHAWHFLLAYSAHVTAWLGVYAAGLVASHFSQGSGRSAFLAALLACAYVLAERSLSHMGSYRAAARSSIKRWWSEAGTIRKAWRLFRKPLLCAGWAVSFGVIFLALVRNLVILDGGQAREIWSIASLSLICLLYGAGAYLFRRHWRASLRLAWLSAAVIIAPWSLIALQLWRRGWFETPGYAIAWATLALVELATGAALSIRLPARFRHWSTPPRVIAHVLMPFALLWGMGDAAVSSASFGLGLIFYVFAAWQDRAQQRNTSRFVYPAAYAFPAWVLYLLAYFFPGGSQTAFGLVVLAFALPALALGRLVERRAGWLSGRSFALPFYLLNYTCLLAGVALVAHERPALILALLYGALIFGLSAWVFRSPLWLYPASAALPAALLLAMSEWRVAGIFQGWALIGLGAIYLAMAFWARRMHPSREAYSQPFIAAGYALVALGLPVSSRERIGAIVGYSGAAIIYAASAAWLRQPLLATPAVFLSIVPYWLGLLELRMPAQERGALLWPWILLILALAYWLDRRAGIQGAPFQRFPWANLLHWPYALADRLARWWAYPLFLAAFLGAAISALLSLAYPSRLALTLALATAIYSLALFTFKQRGWLMIALSTAHLAILAALRWWGQSVDQPPGLWMALYFSPVVWLTTVAGLVVQHRLGEDSPLSNRLDSIAHTGGRLLTGWSRPFYLLAGVEIAVSVVISLPQHAESAWISLSNALLIAVLASAWQFTPLAYLAGIFGLVSLLQRLDYLAAPATAWPWSLALLALGYGLSGYLIRFRQKRSDGQAPAPEPPPPRINSSLKIWEHPLCQGGWLLSVTSLALALMIGINVPALAVRAIFALPLIGPDEQAAIQMVVGVLAVLGLFYLAAAVTEGWRWLGYASLGMLLAAWSAEILLIWGQREIQWYAIPAGVYLLGVGYMEWKYENRSLASWIDRVAILVLLGSTYWQSIGPNGNPYALWMGAESLLLGWWGSARRLRRLLYAGVVGVTLNVATQLVEPLLSVNRWIVFGVAGAILVTLAILVERRLDDLRLLSEDFRQRLERWE